QVRGRGADRGRALRRAPCCAAARGRGGRRGCRLRRGEALARRRDGRRARRGRGARRAGGARRRGRGDMSRLILVRHCEPEEDARGLCYGRLDIGLSDAGREHAKRLAAGLARLEWDAVYASPRVRARETAHAVAAARDVLVDEGLRELDFGELEGRSYDEIAASDPELYRAWMERPTTVRFPGGESFADLKARALKSLERIRA